MQHDLASSIIINNNLLGRKKKIRDIGGNLLSHSLILLYNLYACLSQYVGSTPHIKYHVFGFNDCQSHCQIA